MTLDVPPAASAEAGVGSERTSDAVPEVGVDGGLTVKPYGAPAFAGMPIPAAEEPLAPAPDPALVESTSSGDLPRIGPDGRRPVDVYGRPFPRGDDRARLVVIVTDVGLSEAASDAAVHRLPGPVVVAIDAYAARPRDWMRAARQAGHEVLAEVPLQPADGTATDAGPRALLPGLEADVRQRLTSTLGRFGGYVGVLLDGGEGIGDGAARLAPALAVLRERGLLLVDGEEVPSAPLFQAAAAQDMARVRVNVAIGEGDADAIDRRLAALEQTAREQFVAVGTIGATPIGLERLRTWIARLDTTRYVLAPVSAVATGIR